MNSSECCGHPRDAHDRLDSGTTVCRYSGCECIPDPRNKNYAEGVEQEKQ